jgi:hypothetical protein
MYIAHRAYPYGIGRRDARPCVSFAHCDDAVWRPIWITPCKRSAARGTVVPSSENCVAVQPATGLRGREHAYPELRSVCKGLSTLNASGIPLYGFRAYCNTPLQNASANHINQLNHSSDNNGEETHGRASLRPMPYLTPSVPLGAGRIEGRSEPKSGLPLIFGRISSHFRTGDKNFVRSFLKCKN